MNTILYVVQSGIFLGLLGALAYVDLRWWILPRALTVPGITLGILFSDSHIDAALGAIDGFLVFWAFEVVGAKVARKDALGAGDKYLVAMLGAFLSWRALHSVVFLAALQGTCVGILMLVLTGRAGPKYESDDWTPANTSLPFGPWLALAGVEVWLLKAWSPVLSPQLAILLGIS